MTVSGGAGGKIRFCRYSIRARRQNGCSNMPVELMGSHSPSHDTSADHFVGAIPRNSACSREDGDSPNRKQSSASRCAGNSSCQPSNATVNPFLDLDSQTGNPVASAACTFTQSDPSEKPTAGYSDRI